jgi:predicted glycosyltransferase
MINKSFLLFLPILFTEICFSKDLKPSEDRRKVEFFEKLYDIKIKGVKPIDEYQDPDTFYSEIAKQVGIPKIVYEVVEEKFGWKNDEESFLLLMIKGGGNNNAWGVMVTKVPTVIKNLQGNIKNAKTAEEKKKFISERVDLLREMEMRMVVVGYDGKISFPQKKN